ncbi:MAG TPA: FAD-dependent oxidoreductase [Pyrinomonadaceae bacterium]|nr:FAD-dependent oxidoreductase [Pyrinomonadaceae bacterium]
MFSRPENHDVIVAGGGPAGLSAVLWCAELGLRPILIEQADEPGGQMLNIYDPVTYYPGITCSSGCVLRDSFLESLSKTAYRHEYGSAIIEIDVNEKAVKLNDGRRFAAAAIIIATGVRRRSLGVEGEDHFYGRGILVSGARDRKLAAGKRVAVIGGGDAAAENALMLAENADRVFLIHRRDKMSARSEFTEAVQRNSRIEFLGNRTVAAFNGGERLEQLEIRNLDSNQTETLAADLAIVRIGVEPNTSVLSGGVELDDDGYIIVDSECKTSVDGVYAAGDAANPISPTIITAAGMGSTAAKAIAAWINRGPRI